MKQLQVSSLRSGSSGNLYLLEMANSRFVVDCGVNGKQFAKALAEADVPEDEIKNIGGILITHEHSDHICGLGVVARRYGLPIYITEKTFAEAEDKLGKIEESLIRIIRAEETFYLFDMAIHPFQTYHDAVDPLGFVFETEQTKIALCTDTGRVDETILSHIQGSQLVFMETNYEPDLLEAGSYPWPLKKRIKSERGHLSNQEGAEVCLELLKDGTEHFVLSHLSQENNFPLIASMVVRDLLTQEGAVDGRDYTLSVAKRYKASEKRQFSV